MPTPDLRLAFVQYALAVKGKTQRDVAARAGTTPATVARTIRGQRDGDHAAAVWRALAELTGYPQKVLRDPPALVPDAG